MIAKLQLHIFYFFYLRLTRIWWFCPKQKPMAEKNPCGLSLSACHCIFYSVVQLQTITFQCLRSTYCWIFHYIVCCSIWHSLILLSCGSAVVVKSTTYATGALSFKKWHSIVALNWSRPLATFKLCIGLGLLITSKLKDVDWCLISCFC